MSDTPIPAAHVRRVTQPMGRVVVPRRTTPDPHPIFGTPKFVLVVTILAVLTMLVQVGLHYTYGGFKNFGIEYTAAGIWLFWGLYTFVAFNVWAFGRGDRYTFLWPRVYKRPYQTEWVKNHTTGAYHPPENGSVLMWLMVNIYVVIIGFIVPYMLLISN